MVQAKAIHSFCLNASFNNKIFSDAFMTRISRHSKRPLKRSSLLQFSPFTSVSSTQNTALEWNSGQSLKFFTPFKPNIHRISHRSFGSSNEDLDEILTPGSILITNDQNSEPTLEEKIPKINRIIEHIRDILGYPNYGILLAFVEDSAIQELNSEFLGKDRPTDILSFPFDGDVIVEPGVLRKPDFDIPDLYHMGDMIISVPYVMRRAEEDMMDLKKLKDEGENEEYEEDRGISGIMSTMPTVEERIPALLVHGMLHLMGYDHIEDNDYEIMVRREEEVWEELQRRINIDDK